MDRKFIAWTLFALGLGAAAFGFVVACVEAYHALRSQHPVVWQNLTAAGVFLIGGAALVQTGNIRDVLGIIRDAIPLFQSQRPGGRRRTDPSREDQGAP